MAGDMQSNNINEDLFDKIRQECRKNNQEKLDNLEKKTSTFNMQLNSLEDSLDGYISLKCLNLTKEEGAKYLNNLLDNKDKKLKEFQICAKLNDLNISSIYKEIKSRQSKTKEEYDNCISNCKKLIINADKININESLINKSINSCMNIYLKNADDLFRDMTDKLWEIKEQL